VNMSSSLRQVDITEEMEQIETIDRRSNDEREVNELQHKAAVAKAKALKTFSAMIASFREYEALSSTPAILKALLNHEVEKPQSLLNAQFNVDSLAQSVLSDTSLASLPVVGEKIKVDTTNNVDYWIRKSEEATENKIKQFWNDKARYGLDPQDKEDAKDMEFVVDTAAESMNKNDSYIALSNLWKASCSTDVANMFTMTFPVFLNDAKRRFEEEQKENKALRLRVVPYSDQNLIEFIAIGMVSSGTSTMKLSDANEAFHGISNKYGNIATLAVWRDTDGNVIYYDEDDDTISISPDNYDKGLEVPDDDFRPKPVLALNITRSDVDLYFPETLWTQIRPYAWYQINAADNGRQDLYTIYRPWQTSGKEDHLNAWNSALKQIQDYTASVFVEDFVKLNSQYDTVEKVIGLLDSYKDEPYKFCSHEQHRVYINGRNMAKKRYKINKEDNEETKAYKLDLRNAVQDFKIWIDEYWPEKYYDEKDEPTEATGNLHQKGNDELDSDVEEDEEEEEGNVDSDGEEDEEEEEGNADDESPQAMEQNDVSDGDLSGAEDEEEEGEGEGERDEGDEEDEEDEENEEDEEGEEDDGDEGDKKDVDMLDSEEDSDYESEEGEEGDSSDAYFEEGDEDEDEDESEDEDPGIGSTIFSLRPTSHLASRLDNLSLASTTTSTQRVWWGTRSAWWASSYRS